ncbi:MAG: HAD family hydrolase [Chloroflexi bacterium]|nr:MAG: HAD family hydrolase [Chloroflexota bacterium]
MPPKDIPALNGRTIRCLLFDVGETLWTRQDDAKWDAVAHAGNLRALTLLRQHCNSPIPANTDETLLGQQLRTAIDKHARNMIIQTPYREPNGVAAVGTALAELDLPAVDTELAAAIFEAMRMRIPESRALFEDCLATLAELQRRGFLLGVVTNRMHGSAAFLEDMRLMGLLDYFAVPHIAVSADLGIRKPAPEIFLYVLNALGVPPQEAAMVGDGLRTDVAGAQQLGTFSIWIPQRRVQTNTLTGARYVSDDQLLAQVRHHEGQKYAQMLSDIKPDLIIARLSDLLDIFVKAGSP